MAKKSKHTTEEFGDLDYWLSQWLSSKGPRPSTETHRAYRTDITQFLNATPKPFDQVTKRDVADYIESLKARKGVGKRSIARKLAALRSFYKYLRTHEVVTIDLEGIERPKIHQEINHGQQLTEAEVQTLIKEAANDPPLQLLMRFLYRTGCRINEALKLQWRGLNPLTEKGGEAHIKGKGGHYDDVYVPEPLWSDILNSRGEAGDRDRVFASLNYFKIYRGLKKLAKAAQIDKDVTPHSFRHAFISHALERGVPINIVREAARHADISTTGLYAHASSTAPAADALPEDVK